MFFQKSKFLIILFALLLLTTGIFYSNKTSAQASNNLITGSCGGVFNVDSMVDFLYEFSGDSLDNETTSALISVNFDTQKMDISLQKVKMANAVGRTKGPQSGDKKTRNVEVFTQIDFTINDFPGVSGAKIVSIIVESPEPEEFLLLPVNGGNTFLIQGKTFGAAGVCQKL
jgi:hypothetical protein